MNKHLLTILVALFLCAAVRAQTPTIRPVDRIHEFGHIGIDFFVYHTYRLANNSAEPVNILEVLSKCECTRIEQYDTLIPPGDTGHIRVEFSTRDYYGPVQRGIAVILDDSARTAIDFDHRAVVGQWFFGLKPDPISVFMLPKHRALEVTVTNTEHDEIRMSLVEQADTSFSIRILEDEADRGEQVKLKVVPSTGLSKGTYMSSFTIAVAVEGGAEPALLTIPVKIVRY